MLRLSQFLVESFPRCWHVVHIPNFRNDSLIHLKHSSQKVCKVVRSKAPLTPPVLGEGLVILALCTSWHEVGVVTWRVVFTLTSCGWRALLARWFYLQPLLHAEHCRSC